jgi:hypothetical protein
LYPNRCVIARIGRAKKAEGNVMSDKREQRDMRDLQRTDESRAAEKKAGEAPFNGEDKRPQDPPTEAAHSTIKQ